MVYSEKFKSRMVGKMVGPLAVSASVLAAEVGMSQPTLSRWLREARTVPGMAKKSRRSKEKSRPQRPQDWSPEEKLRVVVESRGLTDEELGAFLRKEGLHRPSSTSGRRPRARACRRAKGRRKPLAESKRIRELERELRRKEKALAEAAALLILKKKAQAIWRARGRRQDPT